MANEEVQDVWRPSRGTHVGWLLRVVKNMKAHVFNYLLQMETRSICGTAAPGFIRRVEVTRDPSMDSLIVVFQCVEFFENFGWDFVVGVVVDHCQFQWGIACRGE